MTQAAIELPQGRLMRGTRAAYDALPAINWSTLKEIIRSPLHYQHRLRTRRKATAALDTGLLLHTAVFEPARFLHEYASYPGPVRRGKAYDEFVAENAGKTIVTGAECEDALAMAAAVRANPDAAELLADGESEVGFYWTDSETGLLCKGRCDRVSNYRGRAVKVELKSSRDASLRKFASDFWTRNYHGQTSFYTDGLLACGVEVAADYQIVVESEPPYPVVVYEMPEYVIEAGRELYHDALDRLRSCRAFGRWPGYAEGIVQFTPPSWAGVTEDSDGPAPTANGKPMW